MTEEKTVSKKKGKLKVTLIVVISAIIVLGAAFAFFTLQKPYAITANDKDIVFVKNKTAAEKTIKQVMKDYTPEGSKLLSVSVDKDLGMERKMIWEDGDKDKAMTKKEAVAYIEKENATDKPMFTATVVCRTKTKEKYVPETVYKKDNDMFAGMEVEEVKGVDGKQLVTRKVTVANGTVTCADVVKTKILDKGTARVLRRGLLGLPEGEDWKTYEGDPVFNGADELIAIAEKYQGTPYKYGGKSLTNGIDCVQYVCAIFRKYGVSLPDSHSGLRKSGIGVSYSNMQAGDIICYTGHVAIYIGNGKIIHSSSGAGVHISKIYRGQRIVTIRRIIDK